MTQDELSTLAETVCEHDDFCGGCVYQGIPYEEQLKMKTEEVRQLFREEGLEPVCFDGIEGCPVSSRYRYRDKMEYTFGDEVKDGPLCLGMHRPQQFMAVTTVDHCQLVSEDFNRILRFTLDFCTDKGYSKYHKRKHTGLLRNLVLRKGYHTGEILVNIVTSTDGEYAESEWLQGLQALMLDGEIVGVMHTLDDDKSDSVKCDELRVIWGRDWYMEHIMGLDFKVHEFSFFQTNVEAVERLYTRALSLIDDLHGKNVYDLYCGTGTISQVMARSAKHVTGIEIVPESVDMAKENAALNNIDNCDFICGDVFDVLDHASMLEKPDVIVVDPPRVGMTTDAVQKIASYGVAQIIYISCNPKSLVKNLSQFGLYGYKVEYVQPFDNFPMTRHVESVTALTRAGS
ncbi:MAG: 23S rRNA (uracil(1939)-C(5))-methyltransferase RlmD [Eubacterium sp.]|nr:23S rRNA (uracil(1939)-C(5))-methyltransferase RlmD [Eubacterium sp.]